ncbi:MAG TPA: hypothetical protein VK601_09695, partial [Kofleriaceae bacterium]|nr:hypothetical protein [Kofleriaceae bacterium]
MVVVRQIALALAATAVAAACGYPRPADVSEPQRVTGRMHGLWDGADGATLRLQADGVDTLLTVAGNGGFEFAGALAPDASYTVTVATSPARHTCVVASGGNGTVTDAALPEVSIGCTGPVDAVTLSGPWGWTFDPSEDGQSFDGSVAVQDVAFTITGDSLTSAR